MFRDGLHGLFNTFDQDVRHPIWFDAFKRQLYYELERGLAARTDLLIAVSPGEAHSFGESGVVDAARVRVVSPVQLLGRLGD